MPRTILSVAWTVAAVLLVGVGVGAEHARAQDDVAVAFEKDFARCSKLVADGNWKTAKSAYDNLFETYVGSALVLGRLVQIEDDLKRVVFNLETGEPTPQALFGPAVTEFKTRSRQIEFAFGPLGEDADGWQQIDAATYLFDVVFEGDVSVELESSGVVGALLCWDPEKRGGYQAYAGYQQTGYDSVSSLDRMIYRIDDGGERELFRKGYGKDTMPTSVRYSRKGSSITIHTGRKSVGSASDGRYKRGYIGLLLVAEDTSALYEPAEKTYPHVMSVRIEGTVDGEYYERVLGAWNSAAFRTWSETAYDREKVLPGWLLDPDVGRGARKALLALPSDAPEDRAGTDAALGMYHDGKYAEFLLAVAALGDLPERTGLYLGGLSALVRNRIDDAEAAFAILAENEPHFAPGHCYLAAARLRARDTDGARAALQHARAEADDDFAPIHAVAASIELYEGNLAEAARIARDAQAAGLPTAHLRGVLEWITRAERGPPWSQRHAHSTKHFDVASDHSKDLSQEVGSLLEASLTAYSANFLRLQDRGRARVYVFADRQGYLDYAGDLAVDLTSSAGAYLPGLRQLVLWVPFDRNDLWATTKHEGFHQYLHNFVDNAPAWFNEGYAEYFEVAGYEGGFLRTGSVSPRHVETLLELGKARTSVRDLVRMDHRTFMKNASAHYAMSWALVHYLRKPGQEELRGVLDRYFESLREGASRDDAYRDVLEPVIDELERGFGEHVASLPSK